MKPNHEHTMISARLPKQLVDQLDAHARAESRNRTGQLERFVREGLARTDSTVRRDRRRDE